MNWFQARDLAKLEGRAVRDETWRKWLLYPNGLELMSQLDPVTGKEVRWVPRGRSYAPGAPAPDWTDDSMGSRAWTDRVWDGDGAYYPACCMPGPATELAANSSGGAAAWSFGVRCAGDGNGGSVTGGFSGVAGTGTAVAPTLDAWDMRVRAELEPYPTGIVTGTLSGGGALGYVRFPESYLGAVDLEIRFSGAHPSYRCYVWLKVGSAPSGDMGTTRFGLDAIGDLEGAFGPVSAVSAITGAAGLADPALLPGENEWQAGYVYQNEPGVTTFVGIPATAFAHLPLQPGVVIWALVYLISPLYPFTGGTARDPYLVSHTLPGWIVEPVVIEVEAVFAAPPDSTHRIGFGTDGVADETEMPTGTDDVYGACYTVMPVSMTLTLQATVTGGKGSHDPFIGTVTMTIDGVDQVVTGPTDFIHYSSPAVTVTPTAGASHTYTVRVTQPPDVLGPAVDFTQSGTATIAPLC